MVMLDRPADLEEAPASPEARGCQVVYGGSWGEGLNPNPMWHPKDWIKQKVLGIMEDIPWWCLVMPMTDRGVKHTLGLAKCLLAAWKWRFAVGAAIGQFLDEDADLCDLSAWMLAYIHALQCMG